MKKKLIVILALVLAVSTMLTFAACNRGGKDDTTTTAAVEDTTAEGDTTTTEKETDPQTLTEDEVRDIVSKALGEETAWDGNYSALNETQKEKVVAAFAEKGYTVAVKEDGIDFSPSEQETTAEGDTTVPDGETTTNEQGAKAPSTVAEIVAYYNAAANKVKVDKPGYTLTTTNVIGEITSSSGSIEWLAGQIVPRFSTDPVVTTAPKGDNGKFPVKGQSYGSKLEPSSLKNATIIDKGTYYEIKMNFKDEKLSDLPKDITKTKHGQAFNVLSYDEVYNETDKFKAFANIQSFAPTYSGSYIQCKIEKSTGNLLEAIYYCVNTSVIKAKALGANIDANVPFGNKEAYKLNY